MSTEKKRLRVTWTKTLTVDVDAESAEWLTQKDADITDLVEAADRFQRRAHRESAYFDGDVTVEEDDGEPVYWRAPTVLDMEEPGADGYLWSARNFVGDARNELSRGRYREGHCPDLDALNVELGRLEERLRLMALAVDASYGNAVAARALGVAGA